MSDRPRKKARLDSPDPDDSSCTLSQGSKSRGGSISEERGSDLSDQDDSSEASERNVSRSGKASASEHEDVKDGKIEEDGQDNQDSERNGDKADADSEDDDLKYEASDEDDPDDSNHASDDDDHESQSDGGNDPNLVLVDLEQVFETIGDHIWPAILDRMGELRRRRSVSESGNTVEDPVCLFNVKRVDKPSHRFTRAHGSYISHLLERPPFMVWRSRVKPNRFENGAVGEVEDEKLDDQSGNEPRDEDSQSETDENDSEYDEKSAKTREEKTHVTAQEGHREVDHEESIQDDVEQDEEEDEDGREGEDGDEKEGDEEGRGSKGADEKTTKKDVMRVALPALAQTHQELAQKKQSSTLPATILTLGAGADLMEAMMSQDGVDIEIKLSIRPRNAENKE